MKKGTLILILAVIFLAGIFAGRIVFKDNGSEIVVGGDKDEHGCIGSAGYSWCEPKSKCLRIWEESCYSDDEEIIKGLFAEKYNKQLDEIKVVISLDDGDHARGGVIFGQPGFNVEGGNFLAAKVDGVWKIVFDGNGSIPCNLSTYGFSNEMLLDCAE